MLKQGRVVGSAHLGAWRRLQLQHARGGQPARGGAAHARRGARQRRRAAQLLHRPAPRGLRRRGPRRAAGPSPVLVFSLFPLPCAAVAVGPRGLARARAHSPAISVRGARVGRGAGGGGVEQERVHEERAQVAHVGVDARRIQALRPGRAAGYGARSDMPPACAALRARLPLLTAPAQKALPNRTV